MKDISNSIHRKETLVEQTLEEIRITSKTQKELLHHIKNIDETLMQINVLKFGHVAKEVEIQSHCDIEYSTKEYNFEHSINNEENE